MKKFFKRSSLGIVGVLVILQFFGPRAGNPPVTAEHDFFASNAPPAEITAMLRDACYDCHSTQTKWPWYSRVAPVSWWLIDHIEDGRKRLNFSDWPHGDPRTAARMFGRIRDSVDAGEMPLKSYTWMHPEARLSAAQREQLVKWADDEAERVRASAKEKEGE